MHKPESTGNEMVFQNAARTISTESLQQIYPGNTLHHMEWNDSEVFEVAEGGIAANVSMNQTGDAGFGQNNMDFSNSSNESCNVDSALEHSTNSQGVYLHVNCAHGDETKVVKVEVRSSLVNKPFLGGYRNRLTGVEYHNASAQADHKKKVVSLVEKAERDTQTVLTRNQSQQTTNDTSTQMTKSGCYVSDVTDFVRTPGKYVTAAEKEAALLEKIITLQTYWRRWLAKQYVEKLRCDRDLRIQWERLQAERKEKNHVNRIRKEFERRMNPRTKEDFDLLYAALEKWHEEELIHINETRSGPERKAALIRLLEQEEYLIHSIERHRSNANKVSTKNGARNLLDQAASPKKWRAFDGKITEMDTPQTLRAQQLRDLYRSLEMSNLVQGERLDVLLTLKHTIKEHACRRVRDLTELIDREADLLTRNVKVSNLEGLRKRILCLFLQYCKTPEFNPEVARLLKVPQDPTTLRKDVYFCPSCNSYLPAGAFPITLKSRIVGRCRNCANLDNDARLRNDFTEIRALISALKISEEGFDDGSKIAFTIQYSDLRYLVENIWNSQSALSGLSDLAELALVRWNRHEHWSPWNCVLLTKDEASAHLRLQNVTEAYGRIFVGKVHNRHVLGRKYFSKLTKLSTSLAVEDESVQIGSQTKLVTSA